MNCASSASDPAQSGAWGYIRPGFGRTGRSLSENNFAKERRQWLSILLREIIQNALDAKIGDGHVTVNLAHRLLDDQGQQYMRELVPANHIARFRCSVPHFKMEESGIESVNSCLVVEDFGTSGLTGALDMPERDGSGENWNAFWFREGEGGKENSSGNGGAGQGKITYFSTSQIRTLFAYTVRASDGAEALYGASSFLRDYIYEDNKWKRDAYWGIWRGKGVEAQALPVQSRDSIDKFQKLLALERKPHATGLSLVIPSPKEFHTEEAIQIVIAEFFVPIFQGNLVVNIGGTCITSASITTLADRLLSDKRAHELHTCTTRGYRSFLMEALERTQKNYVVEIEPFDVASKLNESCFKNTDLEQLRERFINQELVSVRVPVSVKPRSGKKITSHFDVHLASPFDLEQPEQAIVRRDLLIGEEPIGSAKLQQRVRGLVLIRDPELSRLLLCAEEATHLRWNTRLPRLDEYYRGGQTTVAIVRNSMAKILEVLTEGEQKRDFKILAKYFSAPGDTPRARTRGQKSPQGKPDVVQPSNIPPARARLLRLEPLDDGCRVVPNTSALASAGLPIQAKIEFAYEGLDKDAFNEYDPMDFDLSDGGFTINGNGHTIRECQANQLEFSIESRDFTELAVRGFDKNMRLKMRLTYQEATNAETDDTE